MKRNKKISILISLIILVLLIMIGSTYAYYQTRIKGNKNKSISIVTAHLELLYQDGEDGTILANDIFPDQEITNKTFSVVNIGNDTVEDYVVYLENVTNTFKNTEHVRYSLTCESVNTKTGAKSGTCTGVTDTFFPKKDSILVVNDIKKGITHKYTLKAKFIESGTDQSVDMNKVLEAKINIYDRTEKYQNVLDDSNSLEYINNAIELENYGKSFLNGNTAYVNNNQNIKLLSNKNENVIAATNGELTKLIISSISKTKYNSNSWDIVAGNKNTNFFNYVQNTYNFDINKFKNMKYRATDDGEYSDVVHHAAALAALIHNTDGLYNLIMDEVDYNNLAGWAGDLQTLIKNNVIKSVTNFNDYDEIYTKTAELIGKSGTYFDSNDLYGDIDAINVYKFYSSSTTLQKLYNSYFKEVYKDRFYQFIHNILAEENNYIYTIDEKAYIDFRAKVYKYTQYDVLWPLYDGVDTSKFTNALETATRDAFADFIYHLALCKNINVFSESATFEKGKEYNFYAEYVNRYNSIDKNFNNSDYFWTVTKTDGKAVDSKINEEGVLDISSSETSKKLLIKAKLKKSNKVIGEKVISLS